MFDTYFTAKHILSKGASINLVLSDRSDGKTFDTKRDALEEFEKDETITVYMRRFKTEITQELYTTFFNEVIEKPKYMRFALWEFKGDKKGVKVKRKCDKEWKQIVPPYSGWVSTLSSPQSRISPQTHPTRKV